jgi:hypothetical protein
MFSQETIGKMTATWRLITPGEVASTSSTFSCVTSAWELKAGPLMRDKHDKMSSSISATESLRVAFGAVLGTLTLRYPIPCTRFSPYIFGGGGAIFGGGQRQINERFIEPGEGFDIVATTGHTDSETRAMGQVGGGMEIRLTPHIGWVSDFSWNFVDGPKNNFGMARTGVNFAF